MIEGRLPSHSSSSIFDGTSARGSNAFQLRSFSACSSTSTQTAHADGSVWLIQAGSEAHKRVSLSSSLRLKNTVTLKLVSAKTGASSTTAIAYACTACSSL